MVTINDLKNSKARDRMAQVRGSPYRDSSHNMTCYILKYAHDLDDLRRLWVIHNVADSR